METTTTELIGIATQRMGLVRSDLEAAKDAASPVLELVIARACADAETLQTLLLAITDALYETDDPPPYLNLRGRGRTTCSELDL